MHSSHNPIDLISNDQNDQNADLFDVIQMLLEQGKLLVKLMKNRYKLVNSLPTH